MGKRAAGRIGSILYATLYLPTFNLTTRRHISMTSPADTVDAAGDAALLARIQSE